MASFIVKDWQPLSVLKMLIVQTMHSRSFGGKMFIVPNGLKWSASCSLFLSYTGDVASAMMCRRLRRTPLPALAFIASSSTI